MSLDIERTETGGTTVISVKGEVDLYTSPDLRTVILEAVPASEDGVELHLGAVGYMDSSGVATLVEAFKKAREMGRTFTLVKPSPAVMKVLELTRLDAVFSIREAP